jgi:hypothetical protein
MNESGDPRSRRVSAHSMQSEIQYDDVVVIVDFRLRASVFRLPFSFPREFTIYFASSHVSLLNLDFFSRHFFESCFHMNAKRHN